MKIVENVLIRKAFLGKLNNMEIIVRSESQNRTKLKMNFSYLCFAIATR